MPTTLGGWYRGVFVQAGTVAPITALQVMLNGMLGSMVLQGEKRNLTDLEKMSTSAGAGALSAFVYGPVDLTTIQQQKLGLNPIQTLQSVMKEHGNLSIFRGFSACAVRQLPARAAADVCVCGHAMAKWKRRPGMVSPRQMAAPADGAQNGHKHA